MTDQPINFEDDARSGHLDLTPGDESTKSLADMVQEAVVLETRIENGNVLLGELGVKLKLLLEQRIPAKLAELGVKSLKLEDGSSVEVKDVIRASIPKDPDKEAAAFNWLRDNGHEDLIKNTLTASFGKGEHELAERAATALMAATNGQGVERKMTVHAQTLGAFVREQLEKGKPVPLDTLGAFISTVAKIKRVKEKK